MAYKATTSPMGYSATLKIHPDYVRSSGRWECPHCGKRH